MMNQGGRGKRAPYQTTVMRIPNPIKDEERMRSLNRAMELAEKAFEPAKYRVNKQY